MVLSKKLNKLVHFPIAPWCEEIDKDVSKMKYLNNTTYPDRIQSYPFVKLLMSLQTVFNRSVELSNLKMKVRCQFTCQCFFVDKLKVQIQTLENA